MEPSDKIFPSLFCSVSITHGPDFKHTINSKACGWGGRWQGRASGAGGTKSGEDYNTYAQRLWHEQVWGVVITILRNHREPFQRLAGLLQERKEVKGGTLRRVLRRVSS